MLSLRSNLSATNTGRINGDCIMPRDGFFCRVLAVWLISANTTVSIERNLRGRG